MFVTLFMPKGIVGVPAQLRTIWARFSHKPFKDEVIVQPEGVTQMFYRERQLGKHPGDGADSPPAAATPDSTPPKS